MSKFHYGHNIQNVTSTYRGNKKKFQVSGSLTSWSLKKVSANKNCSLIRSILEYASIVFANLPQYLSNALENIQKSALGIIVPSMPYSQALHLTGLPSLQERRDS